MAKSGETNQKTLRAFAIYLAFIVAGGALLAPWLWYLGQYLIEADILPQLKPFGFAKYLNRAVLLRRLGIENAIVGSCFNDGLVRLPS